MLRVGLPQVLPVQYEDAHGWVRLLGLVLGAYLDQAAAISNALRNP